LLGRIPNNNEIRVTGKAGLGKIEFLRFATVRACPYFPDGSSHAVLSRETLPIIDEM
jgi:hypothetical protein